MLHNKFFLPSCQDLKCLEKSNYESCNSLSTLKGLSHEMYWAFDDING
jgi:hypothetical protein